MGKRKRLKVRLTLASTPRRRRISVRFAEIFIRMTTTTKLFIAMAVTSQCTKHAMASQRSRQGNGSVTDVRQKSYLTVICVPKEEGP